MEGRTSNSATDGLNVSEEGGRYTELRWGWYRLNGEKVCGLGMGKTDHETRKHTELRWNDNGSGWPPRATHSTGELSLYHSTCKISKQSKSAKNTQQSLF